MQQYQTCIALGSKTGISLVSKAPTAQIDALYQRLWREIFLFERQFSRFLPGSELSVFNRQAGSKQAITPEFRDFLLTARALAHETDGLYNPFILPALQAAGYVRSRVPGREQDPADDHSGKSIAAIEKLEIGDNWARIPYGTALDLGGCGKGYLADKLRNDLPSSITGYWLSFGGDIAAGGLNEDGQPWNIGIQSTADGTENIGTYTVTSACGIATSGVTVHQGSKQGRAWHHLIDPRTLQPAETDVLLATVCDSSTLRADVLASCAVILGSKQGLAFLRRRNVKAAVLQCGASVSQRIIKHFGNGIIMGTTHA